MTKLLTNLYSQKFIAEAKRFDYFLFSMYRNKARGTESDSPLPYEAAFAAMITPEFIERFTQHVEELITSGLFDTTFDVSYYPTLNPADIEAAMTDLSALLAEPFGVDWAVTHREEIRQMVEELYEAAAIAGSRMAGISNPANFVFNLVDQKAVQQLERMGVIWITEGARRTIVTGTVTSLARQALEMGLSTRDAGELFRRGLQTVAELKSDLYYNNLAAVVMNRARNISRIYQYERLGISSVEWLGVPDNRQCDRCEALDGTVWDTSSLVSVADRIVNAVTPEELITVSPFVNSIDGDDFVLANGERISSSAPTDALAKAGISPPLHGGCRCQLIVWTG